VELDVVLLHSELVLFCQVFVELTMNFVFLMLFALQGRTSQHLPEEQEYNVTNAVIFQLRTRNNLNADIAECLCFT